MFSFDDIDQQMFGLLCLARRCVPGGLCTQQSLVPNIQPAWLIAGGDRKDLCPLPLNECARQSHEVARPALNGQPARLGFQIGDSHDQILELVPVVVHGCYFCVTAGNGQLALKPWRAMTLCSELATRLVACICAKRSCTPPFIG